MSCTTCTKAQPLPKCGTNLTIGTLTADTDYYVYIKKLSNGKLQRLEATSDGTGLLTADVSDLAEFLLPGSDFELWVTTQDSTSIYDRETITIGAETPTCLILSYQNIAVTANGYGLFPGISNQTILL